MGVFKLGKMTFGSLFKKPETVLYPVQKKPQPAGLKGHIAIDVETCILCGLCERSCATNCISVDKAARTWTIDRYQCIQCGYCITVCPKKSLSMNPDYAPAATERKPDVVQLPEQAKEAKPKAGKPKAVDKPAAEEKAATAPAPAASTASEAAAKPVDAALEAKLAIMDPAKAEKVRQALAARS